MNGIIIIFTAAASPCTAAAAADTATPPTAATATAAATAAATPSTAAAVASSYQKVSQSIRIFRNIIKLISESGGVVMFSVYCVCVSFFCKKNSKTFR